ncbi:uncharacterized protein LOC135480854 [Liolophura sinensis]|uniref:uncharacterized protein LOC135480854 n=1 Tax=Liolophura sinensis TaxID=3198878 RepID=UPI0031583FBD
MGSHEALSRYMAKVLRHTAGQEGIHLTSDGYAVVDDILRIKSEYTLADVEAIVRRDSKKRFNLRDCPITGKRQIRANQGHSIQVKVDMQEIRTASEAPEVLHGTSHINWNSIKKEGLSRQKRDHIHFAPSEHSPEVISGIPKRCTVIISIDIGRALRVGIPFFRSANNVILSPGNMQGIIPVSCFKRVIDRRTREQLFP